MKNSKKPQGILLYEYEKDKKDCFIVGRKMMEICKDSRICIDNRQVKGAISDMCST